MIHWVDLILHDMFNVAEVHQELFRNTRNHRKSQNRKVRNRKVTRTKNNIYDKYADFCCIDVTIRPKSI